MLGPLNVNFQNERRDILTFQKYLKHVGMALNPEILEHMTSENNHNFSVSYNYQNSFKLGNNIEQ